MEILWSVLTNNPTKFVKQAGTSTRVPLAWQSSVVTFDRTIFGVKILRNAHAVQVSRADRMVQYIEGEWATLTACPPNPDMKGCWKNRFSGRYSVPAMISKAASRSACCQ